MNKIKKKRKFKETILGITITSVLIYLSTIIVYSMVYAAICIFTKMVPIFNADYLNIMETYLCTIGPLLFYIFIMLIFKENRYMLKKFSLKNNKLLNGIIVGFTINTICVLIAYLTNSLVLKFNYLNIPLLLFAIIAVFIQCSEEEVFCRLLIYQKVKNSYSAKTALIFNSVIFGLLHVFNTGVTLTAIISVICFGFLMSMYVYCYDDLWGAIGFHFSWNFTQNLIYGMPNSGVLPSYSLFKVVSSSKTLTYDPIFGIEGTIFTIIIVIITTLLIYIFSKQKKKNNSKQIESL